MSSAKAGVCALALTMLATVSGCGESLPPLPPPGPSETTELTEVAVDPFYRKFRDTPAPTGPSALTLAEMERKFGPGEKKPEPVPSPTGEPLDEYFWTNGRAKLTVGVQDGRVRTMSMSNLQQL